MLSQATSYYIKLQHNVLSLSFLDNGESASDRGERLRIVLPDLLRGVLGRDNELLGSNISRASLSFGDKGKEVGPVLEGSGEVSMVDSKVVTDDRLFILVTIPPLIDGLEESIGVGAVCAGCLSTSAGSPEPDTTNAAELRRSSHEVSSDELEGCVMSESELRVNIFDVA